MLEVNLLPRIEERIPVGHKVFEFFLRVPFICHCVCENIGVEMPNAKQMYEIWENTINVIHERKLSFCD